MKNEINYEDMTEILETYQNYVPSVSCTTSIPDMGAVEDKKFVTTLIGGDYLSVARARGAQVIRSTSELVKHTLLGLLPVAEDWHCKVCLMEVITSVCVYVGRVTEGAVVAASLLKLGPHYINSLLQPMVQVKSRLIITLKDIYL